MPCIKKENGKWKYGEGGKIEYDSETKCHQVAAAIHAQQNEQVKEKMTTISDLKEAFDKEPYPFEIDPKSNVSKIVYNFEEGNHKYKLEFAKKIYFGKKVYRIALSQRTGTLNTYRKIVTKFDDAFRTISTIIAATSDFLATHMGKVEGLAFGFPEKAFGVYGGMVQRIISKKLIAQLVSLDSNLQPTESDELGALQYVYFGTKIAASKGFDKIFNGEIQQQATKAIADIPLGTGVTSKLSGISTGQTGINTSQAAFAQSMGVLNSLLKPMELTPEIVKGMIDHNKAMFAKNETDVNKFAWLQSKALEIVLPVSGNLSKTFYSQKLNVVVDKTTGKVLHIPAEKSNTDLNGLSFFNKGFFPGQADTTQTAATSSVSAPTDVQVTPYVPPVTNYIMSYADVKAAVKVPSETPNPLISNDKATPTLAKLKILADEVKSNADKLSGFSSVYLDEGGLSFRWTASNKALMFMTMINPNGTYRYYPVDTENCKIVDDAEDGLILVFKDLLNWKEIIPEAVGNLASNDDVLKAMNFTPKGKVTVAPVDTKIVRAAQDAEAAKIAAIKAEVVTNMKLLVDNENKDGKGFITRRVSDKTFIFFSTNLNSATGYNLTDLVNDKGEIDTNLAVNKSVVVPFANISYATNGDVALKNFLNTDTNVKKKLADVKAEIAAKKTATTTIAQATYGATKGYPSGGSSDDIKLFLLRIKAEAKANSAYMEDKKIKIDEAYVRELTSKTGAWALVIKVQDDGFIKYLALNIFNSTDDKYLYLTDQIVYTSTIEDLGNLLNASSIKSTFVKAQTVVATPPTPSVASQVTLSYSGLFSALHKKEVKFGDKSGGISLILDQLVKNNNTLAAADEDNPFMYSWLLSDSDNFKSFVPMKYSADTGLVNGYDVDSMTSVSPLDFTGNPKSVDAFGFDAYFIGAASIKHTVSKVSPLTPLKQFMIQVIEKNANLINDVDLHDVTEYVVFTDKESNSVIPFKYYPENDSWKGFRVVSVILPDWDINTMTENSIVDSGQVDDLKQLTNTEIIQMASAMTKVASKNPDVSTVLTPHQQSLLAAVEKNTPLLNGAPTDIGNFDVRYDTDKERMVIVIGYEPKTDEYEGFVVDDILNSDWDIDVTLTSKSPVKGLGTWLGSSLTSEVIAAFIGQMPNALKPSSTPKVGVSVEEINAIIDHNRGQVAAGSMGNYTRITTSWGGINYPIKLNDDNTFTAVPVGLAINLESFKNLGNRISVLYSEVTKIEKGISLNPTTKAVSSKKVETAQASYQGTALANDTTSFSAETRKWLTDNPPAAITQDMPISGAEAWDAYVKKDIKILGGLAKMNFKDYTGDLSTFLQTYQSNVGSNENVLQEVLSGLRSKAEPLFKTLASNNGLTSSEEGISEVQAYTGSAYGTINNYLRGKSSETSGQNYVKKIDNLYKKKGMRIAKDVVVYRGQRMDEDTIKKLLDGSPYMFRAYTSTSTNLQTAISFSKASANAFVSGTTAVVEKPHVLMLISGLDSTLSLVPGNLSNHVSECEVIINRGTVIKVDSSVPPVKKKGTYIIAFKVVDLVNPIMLESFQQFKKGLNTPQAEVKKDMAIAVDLVDEIFNENPELMQKEIDDSKASGSAIERFSDDA